MLKKVIGVIPLLFVISLSVPMSPSTTSVLSPPSGYYLPTFVSHDRRNSSKFMFVEISWPLFPLLRLLSSSLFRRLGILLFLL